MRVSFSRIPHKWKNITNNNMTQTKTWVKMVRTILYNAKWIILGLLLLNLFGFGY